MAIPKASENLHEYKVWRDALVPLENGTIIKWNFETLRGLSQSNDIKPGQHFLICGIRDSILPIKHDSAPYAGKVYIMRLCSNQGKPFKREEFYTIEGIARFLDEKKFVIVGKI